MADSGGVPSPWRTNGIEPTVQIGDVWGWLIDGTYELETDVATPIVAWRLLEDPRSRFRRTLLATWQMTGFAEETSARVWRMGGARSDGRVPTQPFEASATGEFLPPDSLPPSPTADPVLRHVWLTADLARQFAGAEERRRRRDLYAVTFNALLDETGALVSSHDRSESEDRLRQLVSRLPRAEVDGLLTRAILIEHDRRRRDAARDPDRPA